MKETLRLGMKAMLALNGASLIRAMRYGPRSLKRSLEASYHAIDPFGTAERRPEGAMLRRIPEVPLDAIAEWPAEIVLDLRYTEVTGSTPIRDLLTVLALAMQRNPRGVLEFGTFWGSATLNLARNLPDAVIHTIDLPPDRSSAQALTKDKPVDDVHLIKSRRLGRAFRGSAVEGRIVQHLGDTATYDYTGIKEEISFFLIDGSHTYEYAKSDTLRAFALAKGESTLVWHDCDEVHPGVTRWMGELLDAGLPVQRIADTVVACLVVRADDERLQRFR